MSEFNRTKNQRRLHTIVCCTNASFGKTFRMKELVKSNTNVTQLLSRKRLDTEKTVIFHRKSDYFPHKRPKKADKVTTSQTLLKRLELELVEKTKRVSKSSFISVTTKLPNTF